TDPPLQRPPPRRGVDRRHLRRPGRRPADHHDHGVVEGPQGPPAAGDVPMRPHTLNVRGRSTRGHTFVEMMIVLCTMTVVLGGVMQIMKGARDSWQLTGSKSRLQESGRRMLEKIVAD